MKDKILKDLEDYFNNKLGISVDEISGLTAVLKNDIFVATADSHSFSKIAPLVVNRGTLIKIRGNNPSGFNPNSFRPGGLNSFYFEIVNPQIRINLFEIRMEDLINSIEKN